jgi:D-alanine-D-alanine ligase
MARTVVGVLRGGTSSEYGLSLKTGAAYLDALPEERFDVRDIYMDQSGLWHHRGMPMAPTRAVRQIDVVVNALHGGVGEDGTVARILNQSGVPFTGADAHGHMNAYNKIHSRRLLKGAGILMPHAVAFSVHTPMVSGDMAKAVFARFGPPYIVKPANEGASSGLRLAWTILELPDVLADVLDAYGAALVEEYIIGTEATVGVIEDFRGEELYVLPPARIELPENAPHIMHQHHHDATLSYFVPSDFSHGEKSSLMEAARRAHTILGLDHFSRSDFILTDRGPYLLEVNALPGLYPGAAMPHLLSAVGATIGHFAEHALQLARR